MRTVESLRGEYLRPSLDRVGRLLLWALGVAAVAGCGVEARPTDPRAMERELTELELSRLDVEGRVSPHLPIRFSVKVKNRNEDVVLRSIRFRLNDRDHERRVRIAAQQERNFSFQFLFPNDPGYFDEEPVEVTWRVTGAGGTPTD